MRARTGGRSIELEIESRVKDALPQRGAADSVVREVSALSPSPPRDGSIGYLVRDSKPIFKSKLEQAFAGYLHGLLLAGDILQYRYEPLRFNLAPNTTITPDFQIKLKDGTYEFLEVKGWAREDAIAKLKICARLYPEWRFVLVQRKRGVWEMKELPV